MSASKVAIVTGGNKGIGLEIVKGLLKKFEGSVYLTARNQSLGLKAVDDLNKIGLKALFYQLDVDDNESINKFSNYIKEKYGGCDILVNNAGIIYKDNKIPIEKQVENTIKTNYTGCLNVCNAFAELLRDHSRVVNISSDWGVLTYIQSEKYRDEFLNKNLSIPEINSLMKDYVDSAQSKSYNHYSFEPYKMSKVAMNALTREYQKIFDNDRKRKDVIFFSVHPGEVITDMNEYGNIGVEEGLFLLKLFIDEVKRFFEVKKAV